MYPFEFAARRPSSLIAYSPDILAISPSLGATAIRVVSLFLGSETATMFNSEILSFN